MTRGDTPLAPGGRTRLISGVPRLHLLALAASLLLAAAGRPLDAQSPDAAPAEPPAGAPRQEQSAAARAADSIEAERQHVLGRRLMGRNEFDSAAVAYAEAARIRALIPDSVLLASSLNSQGSAHYQVGEYELALDAFLRSLEIRRALDDSVGVARVLTNVGKVYHDWGQYDRALEVLEEALAVAEAVRGPLVIGYALNSLAMVKSDLGDQTVARELIARSMAIYNTATPAVTATDSASGWALNTSALGMVETRAGRPEVAIDALTRVLRVAIAANSPRGEARARLYLGKAHRARGDARRAVEEFDLTLAVAKRTNQRLISLEALRELAEIEEGRGNPSAALRNFKAFQAMRDTVFAQSAAQRIAVMESRMERERQQRENARLLAERREQAALISRQRLIGVLGGLVIALALVVVAQLVRYNRRGREREALLAKANADLASANEELRTALSEVRTLKGLIPICANCKRIRDDEGFWSAVEDYIADRSDAMFSHGICTHCGPELYGDAWGQQHPGEAPPDGAARAGEAPGEGAAR